MYTENSMECQDANTGSKNYHKGFYTTATTTTTTATTTDSRGKEIRT